MKERIIVTIIFSVFLILPFIGLAFMGFGYQGIGVIFMKTWLLYFILMIIMIPVITIIEIKRDYADGKRHK